MVVTSFRNVMMVEVWQR